MEEKEEEASGAVARPIQTYSAFISTLPLGHYGINYPLRQYRGFWFSGNVLPGLLHMRDHFRPRPGDLFVASFPKSGTTWTKALIVSTMTRGEHQHPVILSRHPHECIPYIDDIFAAGHDAKIEALPSPRVMSTHIPYSLLPDAVTGASARIVYVCREPKDVLVSMSNFEVKGVALPTTDPLTATFGPFCEGVFPFGPTWQHVLEFWNESRRRPEKILFLKYEEMMEDPVSNLKKLAEFIGCPFSADEEKGGVPEGIVSLCSFKKLKELEVNKNGVQGTLIRIPRAAFFRKGEVGDWKNHMTEEMAQRIDQIVRSKLQGSGLTLGVTAKLESA